MTTSTHMPNVWNWNGRIDRGPFLAMGVTLTLVKYALDSAIAGLIFGRTWLPSDYIAPEYLTNLMSDNFDDRMFAGSLLLTALPFVWVGVVLSVQRLRDAGMPLQLAALFFIPIVNWFFFVMLCLAISDPTAGETDAQADAAQGWFGRCIPTTRWASAALAIFVTAVIGVVMTAVATLIATAYGWALFIALPFSLGMISALIYGYHTPRTYAECSAVAVSTLVIVLGATIVLALEGLICVVMAAPLWAPCVLAGVTLGYYVQCASHIRVPMGGLLFAVLLTTPTMIACEAVGTPRPPLRAVTTSLIVDSDAATVWQHVIAFPDLPAPDAWLFRLGIAYPTRAEIVGQGAGAGAVRYCEFSTGAFVEPIVMWDEPHRLQFDVTSNPPPMRELTFYDDVHPPHLDGFLASERGEFQLTRLPDGRTLLEGTTWYRNRMWPQAYWGAWSDHIIHAIHRRVLAHIKAISEQLNHTAASRGSQPS